MGTTQSLNGQLDVDFVRRMGAVPTKQGPTVGQVQDSLVRGSALSKVTRGQLFTTA